MVSVLFGCLRTVFSSQSYLPMLQIFENLQIHCCLLTKRREDHKPGPPSILINQPSAKARKAQARPACQAHLAPTTLIAAFMQSSSLRQIVSTAHSGQARSITSLRPSNAVVRLLALDWDAVCSLGLRTWLDAHSGLRRRQWLPFSDALHRRVRRVSRNPSRKDRVSDHQT
ncbi:hypothetical protein CCHR01_19276 [Colletotrichum chrysophilum]|uniref:Uncharacterized protein n=1 Tax=Colletotrichum chrysophilum TaxID=1836956 RepID=A0AAD9A0V7_9PEZI|nr:hypothetical protein CCHR01_19276 [Colletotrichum chrysophilum]